MSDPDRQANSRLGRHMMVAAWVVALGLLVAWFSGLVERRVNPNQVPEARSVGGVREVVLHADRQGHYVASGSIDGVPVVFLLDTGATEVAIPEAVAREIGLRLGAPRPVATASGIARVYETRLQRVELGGIVIQDVAAHVGPDMPGRHVLLGMSFLRHLELAQRDGVLTLRQ
ncbi:MAG: TIGR02281 family clan AA aspartic protease [Ectothiorhodospiraceae bacterium]|nr:TIGR02281 family clan AA aspartic protease [Ectothiorhodospiraceae bacterium]